MKKKHGKINREARASTSYKQTRHWLELLFVTIRVHFLYQSVSQDAIVIMNNFSTFVFIEETLPRFSEGSTNLSEGRSRFYNSFAYCFSDRNTIGMQKNAS